MNTRWITHSVNGLSVCLSLTYHSSNNYIRLVGCSCDNWSNVYSENVENLRQKSSDKLPRSVNRDSPHASPSTNYLIVFSRWRQYVYCISIQYVILVGCNLSELSVILSDCFTFFVQNAEREKKPFNQLQQICRSKPVECCDSAVLMNCVFVFERQRCSRRIEYN